MWTSSGEGAVFGRRLGRFPGRVVSIYFLSWATRLETLG